MFEPIEGGSYEDIDTLQLSDAKIRCYLPPIPTDKSKILFSELPTSEQYWKRTPLPEWWDELLLEETKAKENNPKYFNPKLQKFRNQEWERRMNGVWFMNNGKPTYLTGACYYYLNWWKGDHPVNDGYPIYYDKIRERFYFRQYCLEDPRCLGYVLCAPRGGGKCLGKGTKVRMYDGGVKNVEDVVVGDLLMGDDSKPREVKKLFRGIDDMFEIVQNKAMNYVVNSQHIVSLRRNKGKEFAKKKGKQYKQYPEYGAIANIPMYELLKKSKSFMATFSGYKVGVEYEEKPIDVDPYFLGVWLGDGDSANPTITSMDAEIVEYCQQYAKNIGLELNEIDSRSCGKASRYTIRSTQYRSYKNALLDMMRAHNIINNKHIPFNYIYNTREVRLKVLAGLIDSDGYYHNGCYEICQKNKTLAYQIKDLSDTLGYKTNMAKKIVNGVVYHRLTISGCGSEIPVLLNRKKCLTKPNKDHRITRINEFVYLGKGEYYGFEIDGNRLFLLEDGTVTHNTQEETCAMVESITRPPRKRRAVIQSKSEEDAKKVFTDKIRPAYNDLPEFFKPVSNHGSIPDKMLSFYRDLVRGKKAKSVTYSSDEELQNTLFYAPAKEKQLSGQNISELFNDEIGVTDPKKEADVYIRMQVNRFCVYRNNLKIGLIRATTTVEEMDKGGAQFKRIWDESDINVRTANGFTISGLYRYNANDIDVSIQFVDKYGYINREKAKEFHDNERLARQNDHLALNSYIRKNPRDESELFTKDATKCHFEAQSLTNRLKSISSDIHKPYRQGNFVWENNVRHSRVVFEPCMHDTGTYETDKDTYEKFCPKCRFHININTFPSQSEQNNVEVQNIGGREFYVPKNQLKYTAGADPYQNSFVINEGKGSKAGFYIKRKYDYLIDPPDKPSYMHVTNAPSLEYLYRAGDVYEMYEDILKACWFHGCEVLPEANKIGLQKWLEEYYPYFLIKRPKGLTQSDPTSAKVDNGLNSSQPVINAYTDAIEYDVKNNVHKYPFPRQLYQLLNFDNSNTQKFDAAVAWGFTLLGEQKRVEQVNVKIDDKFFRVYDRYGNEIS